MTPCGRARKRVARRIAAGAVLLSLLILHVPWVAAQDTDSLRTYDLQEIVVGESRSGADSTARIHRVSLARLSARDAATADGLMRLLPSARVQTNSRGESIVTLRGAPERQVLVLLDGVPLSLPWDGRFDLGRFPAPFIGRLSAEPGIPGPAAGPNAAAGVVHIGARSMDSDGRLTEGVLMAGSGRFRTAQAVHIRRAGRHAFLVAGSVHTDDGFPLPGSRSLQVNTDRSVSGGIVRYDLDGRLSVTAMHMAGARGIAPEGHLDPIVASPRYWRYPEWSHSLVIVGGRPAPWLRTAVWGSHYSQRIDAYADSRYDSPRERQEDRDRTAGFRSLATYRSGSHAVRWTTFAQTSRHAQEERDLQPDMRLRTDLVYRSNLTTTGLEWIRDPGMGPSFQVGGSVERMGMPQTGDKPGRAPFVDWSGRMMVDHTVSGNVNGFIAAGRSIRFPTMRELFGEALRRFLVNPELTAERVHAVEAGLSGPGTGVVVFLRATDNAVDQEIVRVGDETRRRRVNRAGSRVFGIEWTGRARWRSHTRVDAHATWMRSRIDGEPLIERPDLLALVQVRHQLTSRTSIRSSLEHTGPAWGLLETSERVRLPAATVVDVRMASRHVLPEAKLFLELAAGIDNVTDARRMPQPGLPEPGRSFRLSLTVTQQEG